MFIYYIYLYSKENKDIHQYDILFILFLNYYNGKLLALSGSLLEFPLLLLDFQNRPHDLCLLFQQICLTTHLFHMFSFEPQFRRVHLLKR